MVSQRMPVLPICRVLVRDPLHGFDPQAFLCTDTQIDPQAFLCTDTQIDPMQMRDWFVMRWRMERRHLGIETQRQWSDKAIARTAPCLLGLYSLVTLAAQRLFVRTPACAYAMAWYAKPQPTFSDAIAAVRRQLWCGDRFSTSSDNRDIVEIPRALFERFTDTLCYAT